MSFFQAVKDTWSEITTGGEAVTETYNSGGDDNNKPPSGAPAPTTFYNDYSDPDNPVLDTSTAVEDRRVGDGSTSSEYALENDTNFTETVATAPAAERVSRWTEGVVYDEASGGFVLPPATSLVPPSRPTNLLSFDEQALVDEYNAVSDDDESYTPSSDTMAAVLKSQDKTSVIPAPLSVADQVVSYGGVDLDAKDAATGAANDASAATAFDNSDFSSTVLPTDTGGITNLDSGGGRDLNADLGVGGSASTVTADDLISGENIVTLGSSGDGSVTLSTDLVVDDSGKMVNTPYDEILDDIGRDGNVEAAVDTLVGAPKTGTMGVATDANGDKIPGLYQMTYDDGTVSETGDVFEIDKLRRESLVEDPVPPSFQPSTSDQASLDSLPADNVVANAGGGFDNLTIAELAKLNSTGDNTATTLTDFPTEVYYDAFVNEYDTETERNAADLALLSGAGTVVAPPVTSYADMFPGATFPVADQTTDFDLNFPMGRDTSLDSGYGGLGASTLAQTGGLGARGVANIIDYFDPATEYGYGYNTGIKQLDTSGNALPEIDYGFAKALGENPNYNSIVSGSDNQVANDIRGVAENFDTLADRAATNVMGTPGADGRTVALTQAGRAANRDILGEDGLDMEALGAKMLLNAAPLVATVGATAANPALGVATGMALTGGELTKEVEERITAKIDAGEFGALGENQKEALIKKYVDMTVPGAAALGAAESLAFGKLFGKGLLNRVGAPVLEGIASEGGFEPSLTTSIVDQKPTFVYDQEAAILGGVLAKTAAALPGTSLSKVDPTLNRVQPGALSKTNQDTGILDPSLSRTAGQLADSTVTDSYKAAAESMLEAGVSGVGDTNQAEQLVLDPLPEYDVDEARSMASEMLLDGNIVFDADNNILTDQRTNESFQIDPKTTPILEATTAIILGGSPPGSQSVPTPVSAQTNVEELATPGQDGLLGISFPGSQARDSAINQKVKDGVVVRRADGSVGPARTPVSLGTPAAGIAPEVDTTSAGAASVAETPASGIETALAPGTGSLDAAASAQPAVKAADVLTKYNEDIENMGVSSVRTNRLTDAGVIQELIKTYETGQSVNLTDVEARSYGGLPFLRTDYGEADAKKIADSAKRLEKAGVLGPVDANGNQEILADVAIEGLASNTSAAIDKEDVAAVVEVAKSPDDIIAEQQQKSLVADMVISGDLTEDSAEQLASQLGVDVKTALDLVDEAAESMNSEEAVAASNEAASKAAKEASDNFEATTTLGKTTGILSAEDKAAREAAVKTAYEDAAEASRKALFVGTDSDKAATPLDDGLRDGEATKLDDGSVEVTVDPLEEFRVRARSDLKKSKVVTNTILFTIDSLKSNGLTEEAAAYEAEANALADQYIKDRMASSDGTVVTETKDGATVELTPEEDVKAVEDLYAKADAEIDNATDVKAVEDLYAKADAEIDALADTTTDTTTDIETKILTEVGEFPDVPEDVVVELDEEVTADPVVTADPDDTDIFVPVTTSTDANGKTITECPEGYKMVETEDAPMCQKTVTVTASKQRAGASTRAYTGLAGNRGRSSPGQRRRTTTSSTTESIAPTTTNA